MKEIYFDNNATAPVDETVVSAMMPYFSDVYGNPSSQHSKGIMAHRAVKDARHLISHLWGVQENEIIFTSGATESVAMAFYGVARARARLGKHIVASAIEHECVLEMCRVLEEDGYAVTYVAPDAYGRIDPRRVVDAVREDTILVSIMHVNNELGTINDIEKIARDVKAKQNDVYFFSDGAQAFGKVHVDMRSIDLYAFSGHKMHGPKGVGGLYVKTGVVLKPLLVGGGQEHKMRSGTENVPGIVGLGCAVEIAHTNNTQYRAHIKELKDAFLHDLREVESAHINSPEDAIENTLNVSFVGLNAEILMHRLEEKGIYLSTGSACSSNNKIKSHVLENINASNEIKESAVRISFSRMNTLEEVKRTTQVIKEILSSI